MLTTSGFITSGLIEDVERALTTGKAPYEVYSAANHQSWRRLCERIRPRWERYANSHFMQGTETLHLRPDRIPRLSDINRILHPMTGFQARAVSGYVPAFLFFDCLRRREFPTTITIRPADQLDYLPEPDIFHDIAGHVPMHTEKAFADTLVRFGDCAHTAVEMTASVRDPSSCSIAGRSNVVLGLRHLCLSVCAYGSGLLSSFGELQHAIESDEVQRYPLQMEWAINQVAEIDHYQPLLFIADSFSHLFRLVGELEQWMRDGRLDNVAPGEPIVSESDIASFLHASAGK